MAERLPPICILAGGLGTRLGAHALDIPKALIEVAGEPFVHHQLRLLANHGAHDIVVCVGHLGEQIVDRVGAERFGLRITYIHDGPDRLGTLGAIRGALAVLGERFLVLYGDTYLRIDYGAAARGWTRSRLPAMMTVLRNDGRWDTSNALFDGELVRAYDKRAPSPEMDWIDYGLGGLESRALESIEPQTSDLADLYHELAIQGKLFGYATNERFYEIGNPSALAETRAFLSEAAEGGALPSE